VIRSRRHGLLLRRCRSRRAAHQARSEGVPCAFVESRIDLRRIARIGPRSTWIEAGVRSRIEARVDGTGIEARVRRAWRAVHRDSAVRVLHRMWRHLSILDAHVVHAASGKDIARRGETGSWHAGRGGRGGRARGWMSRRSGGIGRVLLRMTDGSVDGHECGSSRVWRCHARRGGHGRRRCGRWRSVGLATR
jgi:hypothetical protein